MENTKCPPGCNAKGIYNGIPPAAPETTESREHITQVLATTSKGQRPLNSINTIVSPSSNENAPSNTIVTPAPRFALYTYVNIK